MISTRTLIKIMFWMLAAMLILSMVMEYGRTDKRQRDFEKMHYAQKWHEYQLTRTIR